jgi:outer membrane protein TolC
MKRIVFVLLLSLLAAVDGFSQEVVKLTLERAIQIALENNQQIQLAEDDKRLANQKIRETTASMFPKIDGTLNYTRNIKSPVFFSSIFPEPIRIGNKNAFFAGLSLQQPIWLGGRLFTARDIAKLARDASDKNLRITQQNTVLDVTKTFYSVLLMKDVLKVAEESIASARDNYELILKLKREGMASEFDSLRAKVRMANIEPQVIEARSNVETVTNMLKFLLNMDLRQPVEVIGELKYQTTEFPEDEAQFALEHRKELQALRIQAEIQRKVKKIERANHFPSVIAKANWQKQASSDDFQIDRNEQVTIVTAGVVIQVPLFHGFETTARVQQAQINIEKIDRQLDLLSKQIYLEVRNSRLKLMEAEKRMQAQTKSVQQAEKALEIAKVRFQNGLSTQVELNDAEFTLTRTRLARLSAIYDYLTAKADYEKAIGVIN